MQRRSPEFSSVSVGELSHRIVGSLEQLVRVLFPPVSSSAVQTPRANRGKHARPSPLKLLHLSSRKRAHRAAS